MLYTVVLEKPEKPYDENVGVENCYRHWPEGEEYYIAIGVRAASLDGAVVFARREAHAADRKNDIKNLSKLDYRVVAVFKGSHRPIAFSGFNPR
jgi:hypothetical protein